MWGRVLALAALLGLPAGIESATEESVKPVTITVVDARTRKPVTEYSCTLSIQVAGAWDPMHTPGNEITKEVRSPSETFEVQAPLSCRITLDLDSRDAVRGYQHNTPSIFIIRSSDRERKVVAALEIGETVSGTVRDGTTKQPIAGVKVAPIMDMHQARGPDLARAATTDQSGRFEVHGVYHDWGLATSHDDYVVKCVFASPEEEAFRPDLVIELARAEKVTVRGIVRDDETMPLAGVSISHAEHVVKSEQDGRFTLTVPRPAGEARPVKFRKPGHVDQDILLDQLLKNHTSVKMTRCFELEGTVLSSAGRPVRSYTIVVGPTLDPVGWDGISQDIRDRSGHFAVSLKEAGRTRVLVRAEGHAVWEGAAAVDRKSEPVMIRLRPGVMVTGRVIRPPDARAALHATLIPLPREGFENTTAEKGRDLATFKADVAQDGTYHFDYVRPDAYQVRIDGADVTPVRRLIQVEDRELDLGTFELAGTGRIVGTVRRPDFEEEKEKGGVWAFADGLVDGESQGFIADENGHFDIDRVPAGLGGIEFLYPGAHDVRGGFGWAAQVLPGKTTEVHAFDPREDRQLVFNVVVGDGSSRDFDAGTANREKEQEDLAPEARNPMFDLKLTPIPGETVSYFVPSDLREQVDRLRVVIRDVSPGHYHFRLYDAEGGASAAGNLIYQERLIFKPGDPPRRIVVDAASIRGRVDGGSSAEIIAIQREDRQRPRRASCTFDGDFTIRFVREGTYSLVAYDPRQGWCRGPQFRVGKGITSADTLKLAPGGEIRGDIIARTPCPIPDAVVAVDPTGIEIPDSHFGQSELMQYRIPHLWPGEWTIRLLANDTIIATTCVKISGRESVRADLVVAP